MNAFFCGMFRFSTLLFLLILLNWSCKPAEVELPVRNKWVIKTKPLTRLGGYKAASGGEIAIIGTDSIASRGVCWTRTDQIPTINAGNDYVTDDGNSATNWVSTISGLRPRDSVRIRAYLLTKNDGAVYGQLEKYLVPLESTLPTVITNPVSDARRTSAPLSGSISTDGGANIVERGFWVYNHTTQAAAQHIPVHISNPDSVKPNFDTLLPGLSSNTSYEVKAYARNRDYPTRQYGESRFFFTPANKADAFPVVSTLDTSRKIAVDTFLVMTGKVLNTGDFPIQSKGIYYKEGTGVGTSDSLLISPILQNPLDITVSVNINKFTRQKYYSYRAFARNQAGMVFGEEKTFFFP